MKRISLKGINNLNKRLYLVCEPEYIKFLHGVALSYYIKRGKIVIALVWEFPKIVVVYLHYPKLKKLFNGYILVEHVLNPLSLFTSVFVDDESFAEVFSYEESARNQ